jgi:fluoride exporter
VNAVQLTAVAAGGALGSVGRYLLADACARALGRAFPWGTLAVNAIGSLLMGLALALALERGLLAEPWRAFAIAGALGGFTTFSAFAGESLILIGQQRYALAGANALAHLALCGAAVVLGTAVGRAL